jgi:polyhydroxyalkanoate synthesis repressor PhaR
LSVVAAQRYVVAWFDALRYAAAVTQQAATPRTIRRYGNRKLYDPEARRYVTLEQLARLVARGQDLRVLDQASGEDLTNSTLAQALLESVRQGASRIPRQVLTRLIRIAAGPAAGWGEWPEPEDAASRARHETERLVARLLGNGRLGLDDAVALRHDLAEVVHRLVRDAQTGVESRLRGLLSRGEEAAGRSIEALRGRIEAVIEPPLAKPARPRKTKPRKTKPRERRAPRARARRAIS